MLWVVLRSVRFDRRNVRVGELCLILGMRARICA